LRHQEAEPNAENATLDELRVAMEAAPNRRSYIRLAVMRSLLMGLERSVVAKQFAEPIGWFGSGSRCSTPVALML
jgi:hypothetical protein